MAKVKYTTLYMLADTADKLRAIERATGLDRGVVIDLILYKLDLIDIDAAIVESPGTQLLNDHFKHLEKTGRGNPTTKAMIRANLKR